MEKGMEKIFKVFNMGAVKQIFQEIDACSAGPERFQIMTFSAFVNKMFDDGHYGHGDILFLEKMVEQIEVFSDYFFDTNIVKGREVLFIDIATLFAYADWLQKLIWHLDGLQIILKNNDIAREIANIQMRISYFSANIALRAGRIKKFFGVGSLGGYVIPTYLSIIQQISVFHQGTLKDLRIVLQRAKSIID